MNDGSAEVHSVKGGTPPYTYTWTPGGATTANISNLAPDTYTCTVTDAHGCTVIKQVTITQPPPLAVSHDLVHISCNGYSDGKAIIHATGGTPIYTYSIDSTQTAQADSVFDGLKAGTYHYIVKDAKGCSIKGTYTLTEPPAPVITTTVTPASCNKATDGGVALSMTGSKDSIITYTWMPGNANQANLNNVIAGTYTCTITYNSGACTTNTVVTIPEPSPVTVLADPVTICYGSTATLTAHSADGGNGAPYIFNWESPAYTGNPLVVSPLVTTTYTLVATDAKGCSSDPVPITVTVREQLKITAFKSQTICAGTSAELNAVATGGNGNYFYEWMPGKLNGATITVSPSVTTSYTVTVRDNCGTPPISDSVIITVIPKPEVEFDADIKMGCPVLCVNFKSIASAVNDVIKQWEWSFGDGGTSSEPNPTHCYKLTGNYTVSLLVRTANGCESKIIKPNYIEVFQVPVADFSYTPSQPSLIESTVFFTNQSQYAVKWDWNFGDDKDSSDNTSSQKHPIHAYTDTGTYCIQLHVESEKGCKAQIEKCLQVIPDVTIYVPNAYTPYNKDGLNDTFFAKGTYIKTFKMWIFDRWGMLIFKSNDINDGWKGDVNGSGIIAQQDVYVWKIEATDYNNKKHRLIGTVTLVR